MQLFFKKSDFFFLIFFKNEQIIKLKRKFFKNNQYFVCKSLKIIEKYIKSCKTISSVTYIFQIVLSLSIVQYYRLNLFIKNFIY